MKTEKTIIHKLADLFRLASDHCATLDFDKKSFLSTVTSSPYLLSDLRVDEGSVPFSKLVSDEVPVIHLNAFDYPEDFKNSAEKSGLDVVAAFGPTLDAKYNQGGAFLLGFYERGRQDVFYFMEASGLFKDDRVFKAKDLTIQAVTADPEAVREFVSARVVSHHQELFRGGRLSDITDFMAGLDLYPYLDKDQIIRDCSANSRFSVLMNYANGRDVCAPVIDERMARYIQQIHWVANPEGVELSFEMTDYKKEPSSVSFIYTTNGDFESNEDVLLRVRMLNTPLASLCELLYERFAKLGERSGVISPPVAPALNPEVDSNG